MSKWVYPAFAAFRRKSLRLKVLSFGLKFDKPSPIKGRKFPSLKGALGFESMISYNYELLIILQNSISKIAFKDKPKQFAFEQVKKIIEITVVCFILTRFTQLSCYQKTQSLMEQEIERFQEQLKQQYQKVHPQRKDLPKHHDIYHKPQLFSFVSNNALANYITMPLAGILWVGGYLFSNQHKISPIQSNFSRYLCQIAFQLPLMYFTSQPFHLKHEKDYKIIVIRGIISALNGLATALFQMYLPLTVYYTLSASTLVFTFLLNFWLYKIQLTPTQIKSMIVAMIGIVLVINGRVIYTMFDGAYQFSSNFEYSSKDITIIMMASVGVVVWSFIWGYGIVITGKHHSSINQLILVNSFTGLFIFGCCQMTIPEDLGAQLSSLWVRRPQFFLQLMLYTGLPIAIANYLFNLGIFLSKNAGVTMMVSQINILYVYVISTTKYDQGLNYVCLLGAILLLAAIYQVLIKK